MSDASAFLAAIDRFIAQHLSPAAHADRLARVARDWLAASGWDPATVQVLVDERPGVEIRIRRSPLPEITAWAVEWLRTHSPVRSGAYRDAWFVMVDGLRDPDLESLPADARVVITNGEPYHRKIDTGAQRTSIRVPPGMIEGVRQQILAQWGEQIRADKTLVTIPGGYTLLGRQRRAAQSSRSSVYRAGGRYRASRRDTRAGQPMTYPALVLSVR